MDVAAVLLVAAEWKVLIGNKIWRWVAVILLGSWVLGLRLFSVPEAADGLLYLVRTVIYLGLIINGEMLFSPVKKWVFWAMAAFVGLGLGQYIFLPDTRFLLSYGWDEHYWRLIGTVLDPNYMGVMMGMIVLFGIQVANLDSVSLTRSARNHRSLPRRRYLGFFDKVLSGFSSMVSETPSSVRLLVLLSLTSLVLTWSRASWLAVLVSGIWYLVSEFGPSTTLTCSRGLRPRVARARVRGSGVPADFSDEKSGYVRRKLGILGTLAILGVGVWWLAPKPGGEGVNLLRTSSIQQRLLSWNQAIGVWKQHPWLGVGFNNYGGRAPSSSWLLLLATLGVLGSLGILGEIREIGGIRNSKFWLGIIIMVSVHAIFNNTLFYPPVLGLVAMMRVRGAR